MAIGIVYSGFKLDGFRVGWVSDGKTAVSDLQALVANLEHAKQFILQKLEEVSE